MNFFFAVAIGYVLCLVVESLVQAKAKVDQR
jgi:hypothetical protein